MATINLLQIISVNCLLCVFIVSLNAWTPDIAADFLNLEDVDDYPNFSGNKSNHFKILDQDEKTILIGARNAVYNLSLKGLRRNDRRTIEWASSDADQDLCVAKGKTKEECHNFIRIYGRISDNQIMICGTNSYKPVCRYYNVKQFDNEQIFEQFKEIDAQGRCPYNPTHKSTYVFTDGQLFSATVADFSGADPLIYHEPQRTEQYDLNQLNQPAFVNAAERNGYVFFFFREIAMEYMNCGKAIYSRVGRICKNDKGGPHSYSDRWTSFLKTRLNCSMPGEYPFYFNEIQSTSTIVDGTYKNNGMSIIYAVFTTPTNAIPGSAVCAFTMEAISEAFEGRFKAQIDINSTWLPVAPKYVPKPRPGKCVDDSRTLPITSAYFVKNHTLMEQAVPALYNRPLLTRISLHYRLTAIAVDPQIEALDRNTYDTVFVGTDDGRVIKFVNIPSVKNENDFETKVISDVQVLPRGIPIREMTIAHKTDSLIVVGDSHIKSVPLHHCSKITSCQQCVYLKDPHCVWDTKNHECKHISKIRSHTLIDAFIQNMNVDKNMSKKLCDPYGYSSNDISQPIGPTVVQSTRGTVSSAGKTLSDVFSEHNNVLHFDSDNLKGTINDPLIKEEFGADGESLRISSTANMYWWGFVVIVILVFAVGVFVGFYVSKRMCKNSPFHAEHRNQLSTKSRPIHARNTGKDVNLLMNTNPYPAVPCNNKKDNLEHEFGGDKDRSHECKNSTENLDKEVHCKTGTLTKVKRTYI